MRHPDRTQQFNYVINSLIDPCDAPFEVYIESFGPAIVDALFTLFALDLEGIFTSAVEPKKYLPDTRRGRHGGAGRKQSKPRTFLKAWQRVTDFDPNDAAGKKLGDLLDLGDRDVPVGVHHMWSLFNQIERVTYLLFLFGLTTETLYRGLSGVEEVGFCDNADWGWASARKDFQFVGGIGNGSIITWNDILKERGRCFVGLGGVTCAEGPCRVTASAIVNKARDDQPDDAILRLEKNGRILDMQGQDNNSPSQELTVAAADGEGGTYSLFLETRNSYNVIDARIWGIIPRIKTFAT